MKVASVTALLVDVIVSLLYFLNVWYWGEEAASPARAKPTETS